MRTGWFNIAVVFVVISIVTVCCSSKKDAVICGNDPSLYPALGVQSKLLEYEVVAKTDTLPAVIEGVIIALEDNETLVYTSVVFSNTNTILAATTDTLGRFILNNVLPAYYKIDVKDIGYNKFSLDSVLIGSGELIRLKIGMGLMGQDDMKRINID